jgi:pimeloyl-ACP methyl ester carboxylesterase
VSRAGVVCIWTKPGYREALIGLLLSGDLAASVAGVSSPPGPGRRCGYRRDRDRAESASGADGRAAPFEVFDGLRASVHADRSQFWKDLGLPFYGYQRPGAKVSEGVRESFWSQGMMAGFPAACLCIKAFSETDQSEDRKKFDVPTLIMQGDDDQIVPYANAGLPRSKMIKGASLVELPYDQGVRGFGISSPST